jgi:hypothetical protein
MKRSLKAVLVILFLVGFALAQSMKQEKTAEQVYKNIQVFKGMPASQLQSVMAFMSGSLGVKCSHCHTPGAFEKDDKAAKQTARRMIRMVFDINKGNFGGENAVSCYTCHRGQPMPLAVPAVGQNLWQENGDLKSDTSLPTVDQVLARYVEALGGRSAIMRVTVRVMKGSRVGADGVLVPEEVYQKAPNKLLVVTRYPNNVISKGFDGAKAWGRDNQGESLMSDEDAAELEREAAFHKDVDLKQLYKEMRLAGQATVNDRTAYVVEAESRRGNSEKLYFDAQTGLLIRRYREFKTVLGLFPTQIDYEDYKEVDGVKLPFTIRWSFPGRSWGRKIAEVKQNTVIDDKTFSQLNIKN